MEIIRKQISSRILSPGDRLPSIRNFARRTVVSPSTVVEAYDRLAAEGLIEARPGSGFYVAATGLPPMSVIDMSPNRERAIDPFWISRQSLDGDPVTIKPGCGWLPPGWMPELSLRKALRLLARGELHILTDYGSTRGSLALRRLLLGRCLEDGIDASVEQLLLTGSSTQAIDLICRFLLRPGDTVLVDDPGYFNFQALLRAHRVEIVGVPYTQSGPDPALFELALQSHRPKLYITNSALQNPTGASVSARTVHLLLGAARAHGLTIIEDEAFADFEPARSPRFAALDGLDQVIRIGGFSKAISASVRCGYIAARADWIEGLIDLQVATNFGGASPISTGIVADVLAGGSYRKHIGDLRKRLTQARERVAGRLAKLGIVPWIMPRGGFYLWCRLPEGLNSAHVAERALARGVILAPGNVFSISQSASSFMRFNVAHMDHPGVYDALEQAMV